MPDDEIAEAAVEYARRGWYVIPLHGLDQDHVCTCRDGAQCDSPGKHPLWTGWERKCSNDPGTVQGWYRGRDGKPTNVGIVCGPSGLAVIDVDSAEGERTLAGLGPLPACPIVVTRRGRHLYVSGDGVVACKLRGVDIKAGNGFVVAPPSVRVDGERYRWA
ncbi:MAG TPA: bifunctional DNA primase/polymerase [Miltoncostaeaceae bacterium]|nr:bifunctional DNA primase/polymerase [Miltoncostaeaceae bacterium]